MATNNPIVKHITPHLVKIRNQCMRDFYAIRLIKNYQSRISFAQVTEDKILGILIDTLTNIRPSFDFSAEDNSNYFLIHPLDTNLFTCAIPLFTTAISVIENNIGTVSIIFDINQNDIYVIDSTGVYLNQHKIYLKHHKLNHTPAKDTILSDYSPNYMNLGSIFVHAQHMVAGNCHVGLFSPKDWLNYHYPAYLALKHAGYEFFNTENDTLLQSDELKDKYVKVQRRIKNTVKLDYTVK